MQAIGETVLAVELYESVEAWEELLVVFLRGVHPLHFRQGSHAWQHLILGQFLDGDILRVGSAVADAQADDGGAAVNGALRVENEVAEAVVDGFSVIGFNGL